jgi:hypothetical protein
MTGKVRKKISAIDRVLRLVPRQDAAPRSHRDAKLHWLFGHHPSSVMQAAPYDDAELIGGDSLV